MAKSDPRYHSSPMMPSLMRLNGIFSLENYCVKLWNYNFYLLIEWGICPESVCGEVCIEEKFLLGLTQGKRRSKVSRSADNIRRTASSIHPQSAGGSHGVLEKSKGENNERKSTARPPRPPTKMPSSPRKGNSYKHSRSRHHATTSLERLLAEQELLRGDGMYADGYGEDDGLYMEAYGYDDMDIDGYMEELEEQYGDLGDFPAAVREAMARERWDSRSGQLNDVLYSDDDEEVDRENSVEGEDVLVEEDEERQALSIRKTVLGETTTQQLGDLIELLEEDVQVKEEREKDDPYVDSNSAYGSAGKDAVGGAQDLWMPRRQAAIRRVLSKKIRNQAGDSGPDRAPSGPAQPPTPPQGTGMWSAAWQHVVASFSPLFALLDPAVYADLGLGADNLASSYSSGGVEVGGGLDGNATSGWPWSGVPPGVNAQVYLEQVERVQLLYDSAMIWLSGRHEGMEEEYAAERAAETALEAWTEQVLTDSFAALALALFLADDLKRPNGQDMDVPWSFSYPLEFSHPIHVALGYRYGYDLRRHVPIPGDLGVYLNNTLGRPLGEILQLIEPKAVQSATLLDEAGSEGKATALVSVSGEIEMEGPGERTSLNSARDEDNALFWYEKIYSAILESGGKSLDEILERHPFLERLRTEDGSEQELALAGSDSASDLSYRPALSLQEGVQEKEGGDAECMVAAAHYFPVVQYVVSHFGD
eukprot:gene6603-8441_t